MGRKPAAAITSQKAPDAKGSVLGKKLRKVCASPEWIPIWSQAFDIAENTAPSGIDIA
jgi:hypothetical protein